MCLSEKMHSERNSTVGVGVSKPEAGLASGPSSRPSSEAGWGPHVIRRLSLAVLFAVVLLVCRWFAYQIRFDFEIPHDHAAELGRDWPWVIGLQLICLILFGQLSGIYRYVSLSDVLYLGWAMALSGASL